MGNSIAQSQKINNDALKSEISQKKDLNTANTLLQQFGCTKNDNSTINKELKSSRTMSCNINRSSLIELIDESAEVHGTRGQSATVDRICARCGDTSLNSDDLMLSTHVNLDPTDDDVSKDYNGSEKEDPLLWSRVSKNVQKNTLVQENDDHGDEERNDIVYLDSSRDSSVSLRRRRIESGRPQSFSTPLQTDDSAKMRHASNLSTVDSVDIAWTWMSASESANIAHEVSNLKLVLLKMRRLLLDDLNKELCSNGSTLNENDSSVFSEPNTPIYYNDQQRLYRAESGIRESSDWCNMDREALIRELHEISERNYSLQCQLYDKNRVIALLQNGRRRFHRSHARTAPVTSRITRSSTFDSSTMTNPISPAANHANDPPTLSGTDQSMETQPRNVDSGVYQSSSSTDSCSYHK